MSKPNSRTNKNHNKKNNHNHSSNNGNYNNAVFKKKPDLGRPFFAYGIFKPGQIAYSKIKDLVDNRKETSVNYLMKLRDGVPILIAKENERYNTNGCLFYFNDSEKAYETICQTISPSLYRWGTADIEGEKANVLFGLKPDSGSNYIEDSQERENYGGRKDPLFKEGIQLIKDNLDNEDYGWERGFFKLQMNYMLLWSAIDRYCKLKYNKESEHANRMELANEKIFKDALDSIDVTPEYRIIYSTDDLAERKFDVENPIYCINYYYTLRCNIVHRGKTSSTDVHLLKKATEDLLRIFETILDETFNEE